MEFVCGVKINLAAKTQTGSQPYLSIFSPIIIKISPWEEVRMSSLYLPAMHSAWFTYLLMATYASRLLRTVTAVTSVTL